MSNDLRPGERYGKLVETVWDAISIYDGPEVFLRQFRHIRPEIGHLFAAHWCQSEVCSGGFHQFFPNPTGVLAPEALAAFRAIGLPEWASLLDEAMRFFGTPHPREQTPRQDRLAQALGDEREEWDPFSQLDDRFYEWLHDQDHRWERAADAYADEIGP